MRFAETAKRPYQVFFIGISLVALGSVYYHYQPSSNSLIWDRLPMTIAFISLIAIIISDFFNAEHGKRALLPLILFGFFSIFYWITTGDLRFYAFLQFYPLLVIPLILFLFKPKYGATYGYWLLIVCYLLAKAFEIYDVELLDYFGFLSGHTLKHFFIELGIFALIHMFYKKHQFLEK